MTSSTIASRLGSSAPTEQRGRLCAEVSPWADRRAGVGFGVTIERLSPTSLEFTHSGRLTEGMDYLLEIPRPKQAPFKAICRVKSCAHTDRAQFDTPLADDDYRELLGRLNYPEKNRVTSQRTRTLFLAFGVVGMAVAVFFV